MTTSIAQFRQQLSALLEAAQQVPQFITRRNKAVAVLVSARYFERDKHQAGQTAPHFYDQLLQLRAQHMPPNDTGLPPTDRAAAWQRSNPFADAA